MGRHNHIIVYVPIKLFQQLFDLSLMRYEILLSPGDKRHRSSARVPFVMEVEVPTEKMFGGVAARSM